MKKTIYSVAALVPTAGVLIGLVTKVLAETPLLPPGEAITLTEILLRVQQVVNFIIVISGLVVTAYIIIAGIRWATAAGDSTKVDEAKQALVAGLWGAAIVLGVGVIVNTIGALVTRDFFAPRFPFPF